MNRYYFALVAATALLVPSPMQAQEEKPGIAEGAVVFAANCSRCHNARSGTERTDEAWVPIVAHMRARANLTKREAQAVLVFLQGTNLPENVAVSSVEPDTVDGTQTVVPGSLKAALLSLARRGTRGDVAERPKPN